jgi:hypothetical protein
MENYVATPTLLFSSSSAWWPAWPEANMFAHFVAVVLVGVAFLTLFYGTFAAVKHPPGISGVPLPRQRGVERAVLIIVLVVFDVAVLLAFSPSVKEVEAYLDSSLEHFAMEKTQTHSIYSI